MTNVPSISQNVESMVFTFTGCSQLVSVPNIPTNVKNMAYTFQSCSNLGNVIIESEQVTNAIHCFRSTTATKNVYIPFYKPSSTMYCFRILSNPTINVYTSSLDEPSTVDVQFNSIEDAGRFTGYDDPEILSEISSYNIIGTLDMATGLFNFTGNIVYRDPDTNQYKEDEVSGQHPFIRYENGDVVSDAEYTTTYNSFINAGYDENGTQHGVYLKDISSL